MRFKVLSAFAALTMAGTGLGFVPSDLAAETSSVILPVRQCAELVRAFHIPGADTRITAATVVPAGAEPEHCDVRGTIEPAVQFQLRLPTTSYGGRYLQYGCGAYCGAIEPTPFPECDRPGAGDFAVAATDNGHVGQGEFPFLDTTWAADNQAARNDLFYRAPHVLSVVAKRIIATYYGSPPRRSYFSGCSMGGREGLLLAERYPEDFDGVIASAPGMYMGPDLGVYVTWLARANTDASGASILTSAKLAALHGAVLAACDHLDGLVDGQLEDPRACRFDPVTVQCPPGSDQPSCLTPAQLEAVRKLYAGPTDAQGRRLYPGWQPFGSELAWESFIIPFPGMDASFAELDANAYLNHLGYPIGTPHSSVEEFEFTVREFHRLTPEGVKGNAMSLDLDRFHRRGGKLMIWHGWSDQAVPAIATLDYYQRLAQRYGGLRQTQEWARVFMVPSGWHCMLGGDHLNEVPNPVRELVAWVERGQAPDRIIANQRDAAMNVVRSRPVFAYPLRAAYDGTGSIDDASNFVPAAPLVPPGHDAIDWVGTYLHNIPGPIAR